MEPEPDGQFEAIDAALPGTLPVLPRAVVSGTYVLSGAGRSPRGDGFRAFPLSGGRLAAAVCDSRGHGLAATDATARLLAVLRSSLELGAHAGGALRAVDTYAAMSPATRGSTMALCLVDLADGTVEVASAGQSAPSLSALDGGVRTLAVPASSPLGLTGEVGTATHVMTPGSVLTLHTSGLLSARGRASRQAVSHLRRLLGEATVAMEGPPGPEGLDRTCHSVVEQMQRPGGFRDDVAVLMVARRTAPEHFARHLPARPGDLHRTVRALDDWLGAVGAGLLDRIALRQAVLEVGTNVVRHAYATTATDGSGEFTVRAELLAAGTLEVEVTDTGRWRHPEGGEGRGLVLAAGLVDELLLHREPGGTRVVLRQALGRPVPLYGAVVVDPGVPDTRAEDVFTCWDDGTALHVAGAVSHEAAEAFAALVHERSRAGTAECLLDLDAVTHLGGDGVLVLHDAVRRASTCGGSLTVRCGPTTPARLVLDQVGLAHVVA